MSIVEYKYLLPQARVNETGRLLVKLDLPRSLWDNARHNGQTMEDFHYWLMTYQIELWEMMVPL